MKTEMDLYVVSECTPEDDAHQVYAIHVYGPSIIYRQNLISSLKITERYSTIQSTLSWHQSNRAWRCRGVSDSLARGSRDLSLVASWRFQWSLATQQVQHVPGFLTWMSFGRPPLLAQCVDLDVRLYYAVMQNLVYGYWNVPQTIAENSDTPPIYCAQYVQ